MGKKRRDAARAGFITHQYAPAGSMRLPGRSPLAPPGWPGCGRTARRADARRYRPPAVSAHPPELEGGDDQGRPGRKGWPGRSCEADRYVRPGPRRPGIRLRICARMNTAIRVRLTASWHRLPACQCSQSLLSPRARGQRSSAALSPYAPAYHLLITHVRSSPRRPAGDRGTPDRPDLRASAEERREANGHAERLFARARQASSRFPLVPSACGLG